MGKKQKVEWAHRMNHTRKSFLARLAALIGIPVCIQRDPRFTHAENGEGLVESIATENKAGVTIIGRQFIFGVAEPKRITNIPIGAKVRLRMRKGEFAIAFLKNGSQTTQHYIQGDGQETWALSGPRSANRRA